MKSSRAYRRRRGRALPGLRDRVPAFDRVLRALGVRAPASHPPAGATRAARRDVARTAVACSIAWIDARALPTSACTRCSRTWSTRSTRSAALLGTELPGSGRHHQFEPMPNLLALSFEGELAPSFTCAASTRAASSPTAGASAITRAASPQRPFSKEPAPPQGIIRSELGQGVGAPRVVDVRAAHPHGDVGRASATPTPSRSARTYGGRDWLVGAQRSLDAPARRRSPIRRSSPSAPPTRSSSSAASSPARRSSGAQPRRRSIRASSRSWFDEMNAHGSLTTVLTDGRDLLVYADKLDGAPHAPLARWRRRTSASSSATPTSRSTSPGAATKSRKGVHRLLRCRSAASTRRRRRHWTKIAPGSLVVIRQGAVRAEVRAPEAQRRPRRRCDAAPAHRPARARRGAPRSTCGTAPSTATRSRSRRAPTSSASCPCTIGSSRVLFHETTRLGRRPGPRLRGRLRQPGAPRSLIDTPFSELVDRGALARRAARHRSARLPAAPRPPHHPAGVDAVAAPHAPALPPAAGAAGDAS